MNQTLDVWDHVVVGAGSAGSVVASRYASIGGRRVLLLEAGEDRPSAEEVTGARVTRVVLDGRRAVGVEVLRDGRLTTVRARDVVLSAGAIGTPVILLRSGIGSASLCSALGVTPVVDLPGVGENLADHASVVIWALPKPGVCRPSSRWRDVAARLCGGFDDDVDLQVGLLNNVDSSAIPGFAGRLDGAPVVGISVMLLRPRSRGRVWVDDPDPHGPPVIELALGAAAEDVERLAHGVRLAWSLLRSPDTPTGSTASSSGPTGWSATTRSYAAASATS